MNSFRFDLCVCAVAVSALAVPGVAAAQNPAARFAVEKTGDYDEIPLGPFFLGNVIWGKGDITDYEQEIYRVDDKSMYPFGWRWRWPEKNIHQVKSYPNAGFGQHPWTDRSTSPYLPARVGDLKELTVGYEVEHRVDGKYNFSFDLWITKTPGLSKPPEANITREIMIWLDSTVDDMPAGWLVKRVDIAGESYKLYRTVGLKTESYTRDYFCFMKETPEYKGDTRIHEFLKFLTDNKYLSPGEYLRNVALGNEVYFGSGETVFNDYSIRVRIGERTAVTIPAPRQGK